VRACVRVCVYVEAASALDYSSWTRCLVKMAQVMRETVKMALVLMA